MIKTALCLYYLLFYFPLLDSEGLSLLVELHTHCEAPKRGAFTTGKKSRDKYLVLIATVLSLLPHWHFQHHFLIGSEEKEPWRRSDP